MPTLSSHIVKREVASVQDVEQALARQAQYGGDLVTNLLELAAVSEEQLTHAIAENLGLPAAPAGELPQAADRVRRLVPGDIAQRYGIYPLSEAEGRLVVAVSEPLPADVASDLEFSLGLVLEQLATTLIRVRQAVSRDYGVRLDARAERLIARLSGAPDPHPSLPVRARARAEATPHEPTPARPEAPAPARPEEPAPARPEEPAPARPEEPSLERTAPLPEVRESPSETRSASPKFGRGAALNWHAFVRAERPTQRQRRRLGPYTAAMAELDLLEAETRDEVVAAFFDFAAQYFDYSALFAVHGDLAEGRDAHGAGAPRAKVLSIGVPLDLPSTLASVAAAEPHRLARLSASGLDGALAKDLERRPGPVVLLLPIRVRNRAVLVLYGDHGDSDVQLDAVGDVISFAPLVAAAFERVILKRKGRGARSRELPSALAERERARSQRANLPNRKERASALASALVDAPLRGTFLSTPPPEGPPSAPASRPEAPARPARSLPQPVISIGPSGPSSQRDVSIPAAPRAPSEAQAPRMPLAPLPVFRPADSDPPRSRTPIPSSFAPGAPPHVPRPFSRAPHMDHATEQGWEQPPARSATPIQMPAPPAVGSVSSHRSTPAPMLLLPKTRLTPAAGMAASSTEPALDTGGDSTGSRPLPPVESRPLPIHESRPRPPRPAGRSATPPSKPAAPLSTEGAPRLELVPETEGETEIEVESSPSSVVTAELEGADVLLAADIYEEIQPDDEGAPLAAASRSIAHSARPLPLPGSSVELRLPTVIVDLAQDTEALVQRLISGDRAAADRLVQIGAAAVPALVGAFPGPITAELRRGVGDGPPRASLCGPILEVLARIGARAAGVLSVRTNDRNAGVRAWATRLLGEMPCIDAAHSVARRFIDEDPEVRRAALAAGRMLQSHSSSANVVASTLSEMLLDGPRNDAILHMAIEAVADLREARAIPALATLLDTGAPDVQRSAHWALVVLTRTDYGLDAAAWDQWYRENASRHRIEWLIDALLHDTQEIRRTAGDELKSLTKEYFGYYDDLPARERERAQARYREWWDSKGKARFT